MVPLKYEARIKFHLGENCDTKEINDVIEYVSVILKLETWEDLPLGKAIHVMDLIDRRCRIIVEERTTLFNWNK